MSSIRNVVPASAMSVNCALKSAVDSTVRKAGGNSTTGLGAQLPVAGTVAITDEIFPVELFSTPWTWRLPVPDTRRTKNRIEGVVALTHSQGDRALPPPGISTAWLPDARAVLSSTPTIVAPFHDQPSAPCSKPEPGKGVYCAT